MVNYNGYPITTDASAATTNPADDAVQADTGALEAGMYEARILCGASAAAKFRVERRNAANDANVGDTPIIYVAAGDTVTAVLRFQIEKDERIRVAMEDALIGNCAVTINAQRIA